MLIRDPDGCRLQVASSNVRLPTCNLQLATCNLQPSQNRPQDMESVQITQAGQARQHQREPDDRRKCCVSASPARAQSRLYNYQVDDPGYYRKQLDWLSVPVDTVARMRPRNSRRDPQCQENESDCYRLEADRIAGLERGQLMKNCAESLVPEFSFLNDLH